MAKENAGSEFNEAKNEKQQGKQNKMETKKPEVVIYDEPKFVLKPLPKNQYMGGTHPKKQIFLHHTVGGTAQSALSWWLANPDRVGTAFIIDRDGAIWKCFEPEEWAYHLGLKTSTNEALNKSSIGIEIVSWGPLRKGSDGKFYAFPGDYKKIVVPDCDVLILNEPFRGSKFYHKYSEAQIKSVCNLIVYLKNKFPLIPFPKELGKFYEYSEKVVTEMLPGLYSHTTVRKDKSDIVPQPELMEALQKVLNYINSK